MVAEFKYGLVMHLEACGLRYGRQRDQWSVDALEGYVATQESNLYFSNSEFSRGHIYSTRTDFKLKIRFFMAYTMPEELTEDSQYLRPPGGV